MRLNSYILKITLVTTFLLFADVALAYAFANVTLTRSPAPPQTTINDGTGKVTYSYNVTYDTDPDRVEIIAREVSKAKSLKLVIA